MYPKFKFYSAKVQTVNECLKDNKKSAYHAKLPVVFTTHHRRLTLSGYEVILR